MRQKKRVRQIHMGNNIEVLSGIDNGSVTLAYLDPPFNSGRSYDALIGLNRTSAGLEASAFDDRWSWEPASSHLTVMQDLLPSETYKYFATLFGLIGKNSLTAYLTWLTPRLYLTYESLSDQGSLYLHCDSTSSHYLKHVLDKIFGPANFQNEIVWRRTHAHSSAHRFGPVHDVILYYTKSSNRIWNPMYINYDTNYIDKYYTHNDEKGQYQAITCSAPGDRTGTRAHYEWRGKLPPPGRHWAWTREQMEDFESTGRLVYSVNGVPRLKRYVDDGPGVAIQDVWADIQRLDAHSGERVGYETQKPVQLLERILEASSRPGDLVIDPFCGSGTTLVAAERLDRSWIGVDSSVLACSLALGRARADAGHLPIRLHGFPKSEDEALELLTVSPMGFGIWGAGLLGTLPDRRLLSDTLMVGRGRVTVGRKSTHLLSLVPLVKAEDTSIDLPTTRGRQVALILDVPGLENTPAPLEENQRHTSRLSIPLESLITPASADHGLVTEVRQLVQ